GAGAVAAEIQLAVQARARLVGDEPERRTGRGHVGRRQPGGMAGAIRLAEAGDGRGEDLDAAAWSLEGCCGRILLEGAQVAAIVGRLRQLEAIAGPELREARRRQARFREAFARRLVEMLQPLADAAPFGEGVARAQALGEVGEDRVVVARLRV